MLISLSIHKLLFHINLMIVQRFL